MARKRKTKRSMRIVPRLLLGSVAVAVVPVLAIEACGGDTGTTSSSSGAVGVAQACFDGSTNPSCGFSVAAACFDGSTAARCAPPDAGADHDAAGGEGGDADDDAADSNAFGVANTGFG
jgi:hypothetical protein